MFTGLQVKMSQSLHYKLFISLVALTLILCFLLTSTTRDKDLQKQGPIQSFVPIAKEPETSEVAGGNRTTLQKAAPKLARLPCAQQIHLMILFFNGKSEEKYANFSTYQHDKRNREYMDALQANLNHGCVSKIHLFYLLDEDMKLVFKANLTNSHKLQPVKWHRLLHMADFFLYASRNLVNKTVIALNGDIALGEGFQLINQDLLQKKKQFYSLTRYEANRHCKPGIIMCSIKYFGSHDTHIFSLSKPLNETLLLEKLDYPINMYQAEHGMIYTMRKYFGFTVHNPCKTLKTYHHHCSVVHGLREKDNYTIFSLGWTREQIQAGKATPVTLQEASQHIKL